MVTKADPNGSALFFIQNEGQIRHNLHDFIAAKPGDIHKINRLRFYVTLTAQP